MSVASRPSGWLDDALAAAIGLGIACVLMLGPSAAILAGSGRLIVLPAGDVLASWVALVAEAEWGDPASSFPRRARVLMPDAIAWWAAVGAFAVLCSLAIYAVARRVDLASARPTLGRRWHDLHGSRPRAWARARDLSALLVSGAQPERLRLGTLGRRQAQLAAIEETNLILVAPTRSGKTSRFAIPWTIEAPGPVISLSVKTDVFQVTAGHRARRGTVWLWDPFGASSTGWSPLLGCEDWSASLRRAAQLADAGGIGRDSEAAVFWNSEGAKLLAPLLHAAALIERDMGQVLYWLDERDEERTKSILTGRRAFAAAAQFDAVVSLDPRNAGTTYMSAASLLEAYRHPAVQRTESRAGYSAEAFLDGRPNTLYIVAGPDDQQLLAPIVVAMISEVFTLAHARFNASGTPLSPPLRVVADELPNIAPIRSLPRYTATLLDAGVRLISVCQDLAQLETAYARSADTILSNSQAKLFLGPVHCARTRRYLTDLLGEEQIVTRSGGRRDGRPTHSVAHRSRATAQLLQQLDSRRALLVHGNLPAAVIDTRPWWELPLRSICERPLEAASDDASSAANRQALDEGRQGGKPREERPRLAD